jgi:hypothetical protein
MRADAVSAKEFVIGASIDTKRPALVVEPDQLFVLDIARATGFDPL